MRLFTQKQMRASGIFCSLVIPLGLEPREIKR